MTSLRRLLLSLGSLAALVLIAVPAAAQADFGLQSISATAVEADGSIDLQAGSHPFAYKLNITVNQDEGGVPEGTLRSIIADLPPGLVGNPRAVPRCDGASFEGQSPSCPGNTQIGVAVFRLGVGLPSFAPIFNLAPPAGVAARFGFSAVGLNALQDAAVRGSDYGLSVFDETIPSAELATITETIWGVPADPGHDPQRKCGTEGEILGCPTETSQLPFLSLPTSCRGPLKTTVHIESVENPGVVDSLTTTSLNGNGVAAGLENCEAVPFNPSFSAQPETSAADSPTGMGVEIHVPQNENPKGLAAANLKDVSVEFPAGITVNSSAGDGLQACALQGPEGINLPLSRDPQVPEPASVSEAAKCPAASKVGTVTVKTPALDHPVLGNVYLAKQFENPFNSFLALYVGLDDPISGIVAKVAGKVALDPSTGQLMATFENNPQLPFEDLDFNIFGGPRANLTTPSTCGSYPTTADLTPWTTPEGATVNKASTFSVTSAATGGSCASSETALPNTPSFEAGTAIPLAGTYSPFVLKLSRENGSQHFSGLNVTLPPGVAAKFAGVQECSEAQIAQAKARSNPGQGVLEAAQPSCPQGSELGTVTVGAGSGSPLYVQGHAYLAGPYKGAPFSIAIITPAIAGPFDLGTVVVRAALYVDETTAQGTIKSDPIPTILQGIPLDMRSIAVHIDRQNFTLNPTSCEAKAVSGEMISTTGQVASLKNRFQVGGCRGLDFSPKVAISFNGGTKRAQHPALKTVLTRPEGQANFGKVSVTLPSTQFIDQNHIGNPCTRPKFAEGKCPKISELGTATAYTPLLEKPLKGKVYFRANGGARPLPDIVVDLKGRVHFVLVGFVDSVHKKGSEQSRVRATFAQNPDAPCGTPYSPSFCKKLAKSLKFKFEKSSASESSDAVASPPRTASKDLVSYDRSAASASGASLKGSTKRGGHPALRAVLKMKPGEANIHKISVALPHSEFLAQSHIRTICTNVQFNAGSGNGTQCPKASIYGYAKAITPLLDNPLQGPVYLRSSTHPLPDLVAALNGQINVDLVGRIDSKNGGIRSTFENVPDAPVSEFILSMEGGQKGLLENSTDICVGTHKATVNATAQNGKTFEARPELRPECGKKKKSGKKKAKGGKKS